ncbi:ABC transporter ATP-binding protein [Kitasatospora sp. NPDC048298]|uniref:ABC transporter ATP-binding protein n=1 Tax=Kitasatospora sp. NPDC048298 TaxID=3364049 RepID=UPI003720C0D9
MSSPNALGVAHPATVASRPGHVSLAGVSKAYAGRTVLDDLSLDLVQGEMVALLGPSGCGKTTTLRILAGLERPDAGRVTIAGSDETTAPARSRNIGVVFQHYSLFPHLSARENVAYGLRIRRVDRGGRTQRADELLELVGLAEHGGKFPHQLSGGQQQRVALARALAIQPQLLLLDEPLSALDATVRARLREEIRRIQRQEGITTLMVTHDQEEALTMADRVGVMLDGRIEQLATPETLYNEPETPFVSQFVGVVNRIEGTVAGGRITVFGAGLRVANREPVASARAVALIRPEDISVQSARVGGAAGVVVEHILRGPLSSLLVRHGADHLRVDLATPMAGSYPVGTPVSLGVTRTRTIVETPVETPAES